MNFRLVPKSVTLNDLERRTALILRYFTKFGSSGAHCTWLKMSLQKKFTFAIPSADEFLVSFSFLICRLNFCSASATKAETAEPMFMLLDSYHFNPPRGIKLQKSFRSLPFYSKNSPKRM